MATSSLESWDGPERHPLDTCINITEPVDAVQAGQASRRTVAMAP